MSFKGWWVMFSLVGIMGQAAGVALAFRPGSAELTLAAGGLLYLCGTVPLMYVVELHAEQKGRRGSWALLSLLGPLALLVVCLLSPQRQIQKLPVGRQQSLRGRVDRLSGFGLTIFVTVGFVWGGMQWRNRHHWPLEVPVSRIPWNERKAFERLGIIISAQQRYREADWDGDGKTGYAGFLVHLWRSVDGEGRPVEVNLIPRALGFAMEEPHALDGYFYRDLYERELAPEGPQSDESPDSTRRTRPLNGETEWGMAALPVSPGESGRLVFITDNSAKIWAKAIQDPSFSVLPHDPGRDGWVEIPSDSELRELQRTLQY